jgi:hypothetical protein
MNKIGAPKGGRVHWLHLYAPAWLHREYSLDYAYANHCYRYTRIGKKARQDDYTVIHGKRRNWTVVYFDRPSEIFEERHFENAYSVIQYLEERHYEKEEYEEKYYASLYER